MQFKNICATLVLATLAIGCVASPVPNVVSLVARKKSSSSSKKMPAGTKLQATLKPVKEADNKIEGNVEFSYKLDGTGIEVSSSLPSGEKYQGYSVRVFNGEKPEGAYCGMASVYDPCKTMESEKPYHCDAKNPGKTCIVGDLTGRFGKMAPAGEPAFLAYKDVGCDVQPDFTNRVVVVYDGKSTPVACGIVKHWKH
ncbi:hypothetical protein IWQ62_002180 [Dispira parvispora]|uniref:Superoxide dismutase copper/zinc binding domain-containing protein n=1 Tax=Dispira parvispora TaxID=1520584 RepID=A0A9W8AXB4_9FUNG|nr:hypothetical protein IWQ62_002180 [Dispira parvispora]